MGCCFQETPYKRKDLCRIKVGTYFFLVHSYRWTQVEGQEDLGEKSKFNCVVQQFSNLEKEKELECRKPSEPPLSPELAAS